MLIWFKILFIAEVKSNSILMQWDEDCLALLVLKMQFLVFFSKVTHYVDEWKFYKQAPLSATLATIISGQKSIIRSFCLNDSLVPSCVHMMKGHVTLFTSQTVTAVFLHSILKVLVYKIFHSLSH